LLIVLDTNMFRGDVHARRRQMRAVLDGAAKGDFSLVLPEVVRQELVKQYPRRMRPSAWVRGPARKVAAGLGDRAPAEVPGFAVWRHFGDGYLGARGMDPSTGPTPLRGCCPREGRATP